MKFLENSLINESVKELKPYEKCLKYGEMSLTDSQLLAVILRVGTTGMDATQLSEKIMSLCPDNSLISLTNLTVNDLLKVKGIGTVKAVQIKCICELSRRLAKQTAALRMDFSSPELIAQYYMQDLRHLEKEHMILVLLDNKCRKICDCVLSIGSSNASLADPKQIFSKALQYNASNIALLHNHPSGDPTPSRNDIMVTKRIIEAGSIMGVNLIDHIIIGDNKYTSLKEKEYV